MASDDRRITRVMVEFADSLINDFDVVDFAQRLCTHGAGLLDMGAAGVMLRDAHDELHLLAASSEEVEMIEMFATQRDVGPCIESYRSGQLVFSESREDLLQRWPALGPRVAEHYASVYAFPMRWSGEMLGALCVYGERAGSLDADDVALGQALADIATISLLQNRKLHEANVRSEQLQGALTSRIVIEQAKGKFAERYNVSVGAAFDALRRHAQTNNRKLAAVAAAFVDDELDIAPAPRA